MRTIPKAMIEAERKAWDSLAKYKFWMFGYHAAQWVMLNRLGDDRPMPNPFRKLVKVARDHIKSITLLCSMALLFSSCSTPPTDNSGLSLPPMRYSEMPTNQITK